jgi:hypothetical protein
VLDNGSWVDHSAGIVVHAVSFNHVADDIAGVLVDLLEGFGVYIETRHFRSLLFDLQVATLTLNVEVDRCDLSL